MKPSREVFDVAVIGGGSAGLAASVTAARSGARTLLIERYGYLGGMGTASLVHTFCGLYLLRPEPGAVLANPGFCGEVAARMTAVTGMGPVRMGRVDVLPQHPAAFVRIADELVAAEPSLELWLHTELVSVRRPGRWEIALTGRAGIRTLEASCLVDCSGDAVVASFLGTGSEMAGAPRLQRPAYVFGIAHQEPPPDNLALESVGWIVEGIREGVLPAPAKGISFRPSGAVGELFGTIDLQGAETPADYDPLDASCLTRLELDGRALASKVMAWLAGRSGFWKSARISQWPVRAGVRESRRWIGETILTGADLLAGRRWQDEVALATWPMEFRENNRGPRLRFPEGDKPAGIPAGCLRPAGMPDLFVAGRCLSTDHDAQASIRVMGTCFATGEAAGRAAARRVSGI